MLVGYLRDDFCLPGFDEDDGGDQDDQYGCDEGDNHRLDGRVADAFFRGGIASCGLLLAHGLIGCRSSGLGLDGRGALRRLFVAARAGHEIADGFFGALVLVENGVHLDRKTHV